MATTRISERKDKLLNWIKNLQDKTILQKLEQLREETEAGHHQDASSSPLEDEDKVTAFDLTGKPITQKEIENKIEESQAQYRRGEFIDWDDFEKQLLK